MYKYIIYSVLLLILVNLNSCVLNYDYSKKRDFSFRVDDYIYLKNKNKDYILLRFKEFYSNGKTIYYEIVKEDSIHFIKRYDISNNLLLIKKIKNYEYETYFKYNFNKIDTINIDLAITHHHKYQTFVEIYYDNQSYRFSFLEHFLSSYSSKIKIDQFTYFNFLKGLILDYEMYFEPEYITPFDESYNLLEYLRSQGVKFNEEYDFNEHLRIRGLKEDKYRNK